MNKSTTWLLLFALVLGFAAGVLVYRGTPSPVVPLPVTVVRYDTITDTVIIRRPVPVYRDTGTHRITRLPADTTAILAALNQLAEVRVYRRTLADDSLLTATITDTVQYNALQGAGFSYAVRSKVVTNAVERVTVAPPRFSLSVGGGVGYVEGVKFIPSVALGFDKSVVSLSGSDKCMFITYHYQLFAK